MTSIKPIFHTGEASGGRVGTGSPRPNLWVKKTRKLSQTIMFWLFRLAAAINGIALLIILYFLVARGWRAINWTFLTQPPMESMTTGGILPCIVGTVCLSFGAILAALPSR